MTNLLGKNTIALILTLLILPGCSWLYPTSAKEDNSHTFVKKSFREVRLDGNVKSATIDLLARGFLVRNEEQENDYGYYSYLIFTNKVTTTYKQRLAAAHAFLCLFQDVSSVVELPVARDTLAVLYGPILNGQAIVPLRKKQESDLFLKEYDYDYAFLFSQWVARKLNKALPAVSIVGHPTPIVDAHSVMADRVQVISLEGNPEKIQEQIIAFRDKLVIPEDDIRTERFVLKTAIRTIFRSVGEIVLVEEAEAKAGADLSHCK